MDDFEDFLEDAAHYPGGHAAGIAFPRSTADVVDVLAGARAVLPIGAQSSLTGGATPMGELILTTSKMARIIDLGAEVRGAGHGTITVEPGVTVAALQERLAESGAWFPPAPTFTGACAGGIVATNAAGAATFKYGSIRDWVEALTVVLADGTVLDVSRGAQRAVQGRFVIDTSRGPVVIPVPTYAMPRVAKRSAGYHAEPDMDLIDLFIGSEGTLGVITRVTFRTVSPVPHVAFALIPCLSESQGLGLTNALRDGSMMTWRTRDPNGIDVSAIEMMDRRSLDIVREDGAGRRHDVAIPRQCELALLVQLEIGRYYPRNRVCADSGCVDGRGGLSARRLLPRPGRRRRPRGHGVGAAREQTPGRRSARRPRGRAIRRQPARRRGETFD